MPPKNPVLLANEDPKALEKISEKPEASAPTAATKVGTGSGEKRMFQNISEKLKLGRKHSRNRSTKVLKGTSRN